jgi:hypothetical protein
MGTVCDAAERVLAPHGVGLAESGLLPLFVAAIATVDEFGNQLCRSNLADGPVPVRLARPRAP